MSPTNGATVSAILIKLLVCPAHGRPSPQGDAINQLHCTSPGQIFEGGARRTRCTIWPIAVAAKRINAPFDIERGINGQSPEERLRVRREQSAPLVAALEAWLRALRPRLARSSSVAEPIDYMLRRWIGLSGSSTMAEFA